MSRFNKKGFRAVRAKDPKTGEEFIAPIEVGSNTDVKFQKQLNKIKKDNRKNNNEYKRRLREYKKTIPLEERSKINFSQVEI